MLILAYFALGSLPTNAAGVALVVLGITLLVAEVFISGFGVFGVGGIIAVVFGGLIFTGSSATGFQVSRWLIGGVAAVLGLFALFLAGALLQIRRMPSHPGRASLLGAKATVKTRLAPKGTVLVGGERWDATAEDPPLAEDTPVIITKVEGLHLEVKRDPASIKLLPEATSEAAPE